MPGVPSGRGCEGCRRQKKACDRAQPSCGRCIRVRIPCIGSGERKFHFVDIKCARRKQRTKDHSSRTPTPPTLSPSPNNEQDALVNAFVSTIHPSTSRRFNLSTMYGPFLHEVPRRIGTNPALDSAVRAVICAHSDTCAYRPVSVDALIKYNQAISTLRPSLDDPVKTQSVETLCTVMILLMCQGLNGLNREHWFAHCKGAAQILNARGNRDPKDPFESNLYDTVQGQMFLAVLFSQDVGVDAGIWRNFLRSKGDVHEHSLVSCFSRVPEYLARGQRELSCPGTDLELREEIRMDYAMLLWVRNELRAQSISANNLLAKGCSPTNAAEEASFNSATTYNLALTLCCIFNCMLRALNTGGEQIALEAEEFANEALTLTHSAARLRPLGAGPILLVLLVAWPCTSDNTKKHLIEDALDNYYSDFLRGPDKGRISKSLGLLERNLHLENTSVLAIQRLSILD